ncbi:hypothetical protein N665_0277s0008 [Sinapis alba]|nr:hypothetical protein N665_0277s0008 [Sinapis alba]
MKNSKIGACRSYKRTRLHNNLTRMVTLQTYSIVGCTTKACSSNECCKRISEDMGRNLENKVGYAIRLKGLTGAGSQLNILSFIIF